MLGAQVILFLLLLGCWHSLPDAMVASPAAVAGELASWVADEAMWRHLRVTMLEAATGYVLGTLSGVLAASAMFAQRWLMEMLMPVVAALNALPRVALAPVFVLLLGLGSQSKVAFVLSTAFAISFWTTLAGLRSVDRQLLWNMRVLGASRIGLIRDVYLGATLVWTVTAMRWSVSWSLGAAVLAEYLGGLEGLGVVIASAQSSLNTTTVVAGLTLVSMIALALDRALVVVERRASRWRSL